MSDFTLYLRVISALAAVIALIVLASYFLRRYGGDKFKGIRGKRRLSIVEAATIDARRRLLLVRRDSVEHLLLIGGTTDLLIETGIPADAAEVPPNPNAISTGNPPERRAPKFTGLP